MFIIFRPPRTQSQPDDDDDDDDGGGGGDGNGDDDGDVDDKTKDEMIRRRFEKFGYSHNEVWNWLYTEDEEDWIVSAAVDRRSAEERLRDLYSTPAKNKNTKDVARQEDVAVEENEYDDIEEDLQQGGGNSVEVQFSPQEFLDSSNRLAHLDLDGLERFVGNTLEKAIAKRQRQRMKEMQALDHRDDYEVEMVTGPGELDEHVEEVLVNDNDHVEDRTVTITEVPTTSPLNVKDACDHVHSANKVTANNNNNNNDSGVAANSKHQCQTCLASGESSCSSALSSLESVRSSYSNGVSRSSSGSETLGSELVLVTTAASSPDDPNHAGHRHHVMATKELVQPKNQQPQPPVKPSRVQRLRNRIHGHGRVTPANAPSTTTTTSLLKGVNRSNDANGSKTPVMMAPEASQNGAKPYQTLEVTGHCSSHLDNHNGKSRDPFWS